MILLMVKQQSKNVHTQHGTQCVSSLFTEVTKDQDELCFSLSPPRTREEWPFSVKTNKKKTGPQKTNKKTQQDMLFKPERTVATEL